MDTQELISLLTDGLPSEEAQKVTALVNREATKARVAALKSQKEYEDIQSRADKVAELEKELDYIDPQGNPRGYRAWYKQYNAEVFKRAKDVQAFDAKYGEGAFERAVNGQLPGSAQPAPTPQPADVRQEVIKAIQEIYAGQWSNLITSGMNLTQKHLLAGRKTPIDVKAVEEIARAKYQGNLDLAYDEWDKPERDRLDKEAKVQAEKDKEAEIEKRVKEELAKRNVPQYFPSGADLTPSSLSQRSDDAVKGFDRNKFQQDLMTTFHNAGQERVA